MATNGNGDETAPLISGRQNEVSHSAVPPRPGVHFTGRGRKLLVTICILVTELCERLTFYVVTANLVLFCSSELKLDSPWPSVKNYLFQGTCYLIPLFGGWLADAYLGRYNTIFGSSLLYVAGTIVLAAVPLNIDINHKKLSWSDSQKQPRLAFFVCALLLIAFGTGGIKANVSPFGADQVEQDGPRAVQTFFNWFYWFINFGSLIAFTLVVKVQEKNLFEGYAITAGTMFLAMIVFVTGRNKYVVKPPGGSQLSETGKIIYNAIKNRDSPDAKMWLDNAKSRFGGKYTDGQVEDVKSLLRVIPVFTLLIVYWTIFSQMQTTFLIQASYMRLKISTSFTVPAASLSIFDTIAVLIFTPIMDHVVYPLLHYFGIRFTPLRRIGFGMLLAAASVGVAGVVEMKRRETGPFKNQMVLNETRNASNLNVFWQIPQFMLIGISEVLTVITGLEFAYSQAPRCLKGLVMGMFLVTGCLGNYLASLLVFIVQKASKDDWYPSADPNKGHLEYFFFLLAGLMILNFVVWLIVALKYKYKIVPQQDITGNRETLQPTERDV